MDGLEEKLGAMLSDPEAMAQFRQLASALSGGMGGSSGGAGGLSSMMSGLLGGGGSTAAAASAPSADSGMAELLGKVMRAYSTSSEAMQLVGALKPWLAPQRAEKLEKAMRIAHFARAARAVLPELMPGHF